MPALFQVYVTTLPTLLGGKTAPAQALVVDTLYSYEAMPLSPPGSVKPVQLAVAPWFRPCHAMSAPGPSLTAATPVRGPWLSTVTPFDATQSPVLPTASTARTQL